MSKAGDIFENPISGEWAVVRVGTEDSGGDLVITDLYVSPGGRVAAEYIYPVINEWFTPVSGRVGFRVNRQESVAEIGQRLHVSPGTAHDWWNAGDEEAHVVVEVSPAARFEEAISTTFGLARDGKTNANGLPNLLQLALPSREFEDVLYFTNPREPSRKCSSPSSHRSPGCWVTGVPTLSTVLPASPSPGPGPATLGHKHP